VPLRALCTLIALVTLACPRVLSAQVVEGHLRDDAGEAVEGATVLLLDEGFQTVTEAVTDASGAFRLEAPGEGRYVVVAQVEGFAHETSEPFDLVDGVPFELDVTLSGQRVGEARLAPTDTLEGADLVARAVADACRGDFLPAMHGILFGAVVDSATSDPLPGAEAVLEFSDPTGLGAGGAKRVRADENGIYLVCDAPAGREVSVRPEALGMRGRETTVRLRSGTMKKLDLRLAVSDPNSPGAIFGRVFEQESGRPIPGAEVRVQDAGVGTISNERGVFRMPEVPRGLQVVTVDHPGHGHQEQVVRVLGGQAAELEVRMTVQPIEMPPMMVRVRPRRWFSDMSELEDRIENGFGFILTEEELEDKAPRHLADALRNVPGVRVHQSGGTVSGTYSIEIRNSRTIDGRSCGPIVWVDGQKIGRDSDALTSVWGPDLYAVEVYRSPAETPGEFSDQDANCGVIVAWTKRGR
jgi:hypothetical protein